MTLQKSGKSHHGAKHRDRTPTKESLMIVTSNWHTRSDCVSELLDCTCFYTEASSHLMFVLFFTHKWLSVRLVICNMEKPSNVTCVEAANDATYSRDGSGLESNKLEERKRIQLVRSCCATMCMLTGSFSKDSISVWLNIW